MKSGPLPTRAALAATQYLRQHPDELLRALRCASRLKLGVPLPALRFIAAELGGKRLPPDLVIEARSPGIFVSGSFTLMDTPLFASGILIVERIESSPESVLVDLRIQSLNLEVTDPEAATPVAALLRSGALDLSRPGDLVHYMPKRPPMLLEARGNRLTLDLMKHPRLSQDPARKIVAAIIPLFTISGIEADDEHLDVSFRAFSHGVGEAYTRLRQLFE